MSTHHRPYSTRPTAATPAFAQLPTGSDPEAFIARQEAMIQAGTHAMIAEKLALDAVRNQIERDRRVRPAASIAEPAAPATEIVPATATEETTKLQ